MRKSYSDEKFENSVSVVVAGDDGRVISQNPRARTLLGSGTGKFCWDVFANLPEAEQLPCRQGCVLELLEKGMDCTQHTELKVSGIRHELTCIPVERTAVCLLGQIRKDAKTIWKTLSPREQEILVMLANGETNGTMSAQLGVSESTVRTHVERMRSKLCVNTRAAMVAEGFRLGYLT